MLANAACSDPGRAHAHAPTSSWPPCATQAGVDAAQLESYQQLWRLVVPEDQADAAIAF